MTAWTQRALDLLFPPQDHGGQTALGLGLSAEAFGQVTFLEDPVCDGCGLPFEFDQGAGARCAACMARPRAFGRARASCLYDDSSRDLILKFKHADRPDLAGLFSLWISSAASPLIDQADVIIPVPLHPFRLLKRRYNQAAELARPLARRAGLAYLADSLQRRRDTASQGGRSSSGRQRNVAGAFWVPDTKRANIKGRHVLLIDDVLTTGATAEACAKALLKAGARGVDLAVIARVRETQNRPI
jgi:ComF family protein